MQDEVISCINSCPRCSRGKTQQDFVPQINIETIQSLELVHFDNLQIEPSKGNVENVLIGTDHFTKYAQAFCSKTETTIATAEFLWKKFNLYYVFPAKIISDIGHYF